MDNPVAEDARVAQMRSWSAVIRENEVKME